MIYGPMNEQKETAAEHATGTQGQIDALVVRALESFDALRTACPHRDGVDCAHQEIEFDHMLCAACNCPLLV